MGEDQLMERVRERPPDARESKKERRRSQAFLLTGVIHEDEW